MAAETYSVISKEDKIVNTKDTTQAAGPRWTPEFVAGEYQTIHQYAEGEGTIGGPATVSIVDNTFDDLILKY